MNNLAIGQSCSRIMQLWNLHSLFFKADFYLQLAVSQSYVLCLTSGLFIGFYMPQSETYALRIESPMKIDWVEYPAGKLVVWKSP